MPNNAIVIPSAFSTLEAREKALAHARSLDMGTITEMALAYDKHGEPCDPDAPSWCFDIVIWPGDTDDYDLLSAQPRSRLRAGHARRPRGVNP
jgi:hypothetical protein